MQRLRAICAAALSLGLACVPVWGNTTPNVVPLGTIIAADQAHVGNAAADVGTTVYTGDRLAPGRTEPCRFARARRVYCSSVTPR